MIRILLSNQMVCGVFLAAAACVCQSAAGRDCNDALRTAYRSDLIGPEVWTARMQPCLVQEPCRIQAVPAPGLCGRLHVVHRTEIEDALVPEIVLGGKSLNFRFVGNEWTPAFSATRYRADSLQTKDEPSFLGDTVYVERKCITTNNVFVAEGVLRNAGASVHTYRIGFRLHPSLPCPSGVFRFTTEVMCRKTPRQLFAFASLPEREVVLQPNAETVFRYALALSPGSVECARALAEEALGASDPFVENAEAYNDWMCRNMPQLTIGDESLSKLYDYRWFLVWRGIHNARRMIPDHAYPRRVVYESPMGDWYDGVIGLPVPMQIQELAWMRDPGVGCDHILNWCEGADGYVGYIQFTGMSIWRFLQNHPDKVFASRICTAVCQDAEKRAGNGERILPQVSSWTTGAEYQPNFYQFTDPKWDFRCDVELAKKTGRKYASSLRLDTAGFAVASALGASRIAASVGADVRSEELRRRAGNLMRVIRKGHWNDELGLFLAADPKTGRLADEAACYDSFVPFMFGMETDGRYFRAFDKFCSPAWFWDRYAVTTVAKTCPMYAGGNFLRGPIEGVASPERPHRYGCCWNGPVWHYADSLMAEAFGQVAERDPSRRGKWRSFFRNWTETHFPGGDRSTPLAAEHFRPEDGVRLGTTYDYFHSSWIDPFLRFWCGISVNDTLDEISFEPMSDVDFELRNVPVAGRELCLLRRDAHLEVRTADGEVLAAGENRLTIRLR